MQNEPQFTVRIDGQPWEAWTDVSVTRSLDRMSGEFTVGIGRSKQIEALSLGGSLRVSAAVDVEIDGQLVLSGYGRSLDYSYDASRAEIRFAGRDRTIDLVDCAATVEGPHDFVGETLLAVAQRIAKPFGITVTAATDVGKPFSRLSIQPGETAFEFIDRACRYRGVMCVSDGVGGLVIVRPGGEKSRGILIYGDNILSAQITHDDSELMNLYVVKGQAEPLVDDTETAPAASASARVSYGGMKRYRPKVIVGESQGYDLTLAERAAWEKQRAVARSKRATYTAQGWYADAAAKALWKPNTIVTVLDERAQLFKRDMLISAVSFRRDARGTVTQLDLALPEAYDILAENEDAAAGGTSIWVADD